VMELVGMLGFEPVDAGPLKNARLLEPFAMVWIDQAIKRGRGRDFAFALVKME
jgi:predicted dinucleotide-binding enzyme